MLKNKKMYNFSSSIRYFTLLDEFSQMCYHRSIPSERVFGNNFAKYRNEDHLTMSRFEWVAPEGAKTQPVFPPPSYAQSS